jgi:hypothetical protein
MPANVHASRNQLTDHLQLARPPPDWGNDQRLVTDIKKAG